MRAGHRMLLQPCEALRSLRPTPSYNGLFPASSTASRLASAGSAKRNTRPERLLRRALRGKGLRCRSDVAALPGRPDLVIASSRLAVFCDGDFWHGRNLAKRLKKLAKGHNAPYWVAKIRSNVQRDRRVARLLRQSGWRVLRLWESDIKADTLAAARAVIKASRRAL